MHSAPYKAAPTKGDSGLFPSIVRSALWNQEEISALSKTQTKADKQAFRIADYVQVYGESIESASSRSHTRQDRKTDPSARFTFSRGTAGTVVPFEAPTEPSAIQSTGQLISPRNISSSERCMERLKAEMEKLAQTVQKAASDRLELMRDLATYEHLFCKATAAGEKLEELWRVAGQFPAEYVSMTKASSWEHSAQSEIRNGFQRVEAVDSASPLQLPSEAFEKSTFDLRLLNDISRYRQLFRGVYRVSNVHCLITVKSNGLFRQLIIHAMTLEGAGYPLTVRQDMMERESLMTKKQIKSAVKSFILPHLYFQTTASGSQLMFHQSYGVTFLTAVVALKGLGAPGPMAVQVTQERDNVFLTLGSGELTLARTELTRKSSIFKEKHQRIAERLQRHLLFLRSDRSVIWQASAAPSGIFSQQETNSPFLNEEFISERLQTLSFQLQSSEKLTIDSVAYRVEFLYHKHLMKLRIACGELVRDVEPGSREMQILTELQSADWKNCKNTLLRSLELKMIIKQTFKL